MAAAEPILYWPRPVSRMTMSAVRVDVPGPPLVMRSACPNMFADARNVIVSTNASTGRRPGRVTCRNRWPAEAPSTSAAS